MVSLAHSIPCGVHEMILSVRLLYIILHNPDAFHATQYPERQCLLQPTQKISQHNLGTRRQVRPNMKERERDRNPK